MRIVVFGSTGGTGLFVVQEAIARGHQVTAFARRRAALDGVEGLAAIAEGDGRDQDAVRAALTGQDAVIVTVSGRGQPDVVRDIVRVVTASMHDIGVPRLVVTSAYGLVATKPLVLAGLVRRMFAKPFADQLAADHIVQASDLNWTIARATRLKGGPSSGPARMSSGLFVKGPYALSRGTWAEVLVDLATDATYPRAIVNVTG